MIRKLVLAAVFLAAFGTYVSRAYSEGTLNAPPEAGDGPDYDMLAFNLWHNRGYGYDWENPEWRKPYLPFPRYTDLLVRHQSYSPTTYRPPLMPVLLSIVYRLAGRHFAVWRIVNCGIEAAAITTAAAIAAEFAGIAAAIACALFVLQIPDQTTYASAFVTEPLATWMVTLLAWTWLMNARHGWTTARAIRSGVVLAALVAARSIFVLWMPFALLVPGRDASSGAKRAWRAKAMSLVVAVLVIGPWWVRNIVVTKAFLPMGTEGAINLTAAFGPRALGSNGLWAANHGDGAQELFAQNLDPLTWEVRLAQVRSDLTIKWMRSHPLDVVRLMGLHVWQEIRPHNDPFADYLLPAACAAILFLMKTPGIGVFAIVLCAQIASVAATWSVGGRFMVPVQPLFVAVTCAAATEWMLHGTRWWRPQASAGPGSSATSSRGTPSPM